MAKLVWRVKLVAEFDAGETTELEVARIERDGQTGLAGLGLRLAEAKQLTAAIQAEIVPAQVMIAGECRRTCAACRHVLASKGHYTATFRSLFGDVPIRVQRLLACPCQDMAKAKSFSAFDLQAATVAPELAYVTARYAALAPFGKVADLLWNCCRSAGRETRARCEIGRCGPARRLCSRTPRKRQRRRRCSQPNPSLLGLMAATSAAGTARMNAILR